MAIAQSHLLPSVPLTTRAGRGQEEEGGANYSTSLPGLRCWSAAFQDAITELWEILPCPPTTRSPSRTPRRTASSPLDRSTSRRTTRPSTWLRLLTSVKDDKDKMAITNECRRMKIRVLRPT